MLPEPPEERKFKIPVRSFLLSQERPNRLKLLPASEFYIQVVEAFQTFLSTSGVNGNLAWREARQELECSLEPAQAPDRHLLVVSNRGDDMVQVFIEAPYEIFEGDTRYYVHREGNLNPDEAETWLTELLHSAFQRLLEWNATKEKSIYKEL
jgi:hypothetical protein